MHAAVPMAHVFIFFSRYLVLICPELCPDSRVNQCCITYVQRMGYSSLQPETGGHSLSLTATFRNRNQYKFVLSLCNANACSFKTRYKERWKHGYSNLAPRMLEGDFAPGFYVKHFIKDMSIAADFAKKDGTGCGRLVSRLVAVSSIG